MGDSVGSRKASDTRCILVTGGAGYIGSSTCYALAKAGFLPITYDNLSCGHADFVRWGPLIRGDILDRECLVETIERYRPLACIHLAALAYVGDSVSDPVAYYRTNVAGTLTLAQALIEHRVYSLVFSSSCAIYGIPQQVPIKEDATPQPINPYGRSKLMVEQMLRDLDAAYQFRSISLRYFNACGAHEEGRVGEVHDPEPHLIPKAIMAALGQVGELEIFGTDYPTRDGSAIRDYLHVADLADAHVLALGHVLQSGKSDAFNLGLGRGYTVREVVSAIQQIAGRKVPVRECSRRDGDPPELVADSSRAQSLLGFSPRYQELAEMIRTAWQWHSTPRLPVVT